MLGRTDVPHSGNDIRKENLIDYLVNDGCAYVKYCAHLISRKTGTSDSKGNVSQPTGRAKILVYQIIFVLSLLDIYKYASEFFQLSLHTLNFR